MVTLEDLGKLIQSTSLYWKGSISIHVYLYLYLFKHAYYMLGKLLDVLQM